MLATAGVSHQTKRVALRPIQRSSVLTEHCVMTLGHHWNNIAELSQSGIHPAQLPAHCSKSFDDSDLLPAAILLAWMSNGGEHPLAFVDGRPYFVPNDNILGPAMASGIYEPMETALVAGYLDRGDTVVDVGAAVGYYTMVAAAAVGPEGSVLAIEPHPSNLLLLDRNLYLNGFDHVAVYAAAASDDSGAVLKLHSSGHNAGDHRLFADPSEWRFTLPVAVCTVDDLAEGMRVDLLKVDVQGWEVRVLKGALGTICRSKRMVLAIEFWPHGLRLAGNSNEEFADLLYGNDFSVYHINEPVHKLAPLGRQGLLELINPASDHFANLWCVKN